MAKTFKKATPKGKKKYSKYYQKITLKVSFNELMLAAICPVKKPQSECE